jgi:hypothetical protein
MCLLSDLASQVCFFFMELIVSHVGTLGSRFVWLHKRSADTGRQISLQDFFLFTLMSVNSYCILKFHVFCSLHCTTKISAI